MMAIQSNLDLRERVENKKFRFGQTDHYYPCMVQTEHGEKPALFTIDQIEVALERAAANPEDIPRKDFLEYIFGSIFG